jgi:electron transfer flavoprotein beta subunit
MRILVCIKQVPDSKRVDIDPQTGVLARSGIETKLNPYDLYALELAFELCERYGGTTEVMTMGPEQAADSVAEAVYMGAQGGVLLTDNRFAGADVLATSFTIAQGIRRSGPYDLIICGKQTTDGDTAQVGAEIAELLNIPHISNVLEVEEVSSADLTAITDAERSILKQRLPLPCLICCEGGINTPRLPSYKRKRQLENTSLVTWGLNDLDDQDPGHYGLSGSPTQVERIFPPEKGGEKQMFSGSAEDLATRLVDILRERKFIR